MTARPRIPVLTDAAIAACCDLARGIDPDLDPDSLLAELEVWRTSFVFDPEVHEEEPDEFPDDPLADLGLGDLAQALAVRVGDAGSNLLLPIGPWSGTGRGLSGDVLRVPAEGEPTITSWDYIQHDPNVRWWLRPGDAVTGGCTETGHQLDTYAYEACVPFPFDGKAWEQTREDYIDQGDWQLSWQGQQADFDLTKVKIRYVDPFTTELAGEWLEHESRGTSMTTGEIGETLWVKRDGTAWRSDWGCSCTFLGRIDPQNPVTSILEDAQGDPLCTSIRRIDSQVLDPARLRPLFDLVSGNDDNFDPDSCTVRCVGFEGTAAEYIAATRRPAPTS